MTDLADRYRLAELLGSGGVADVYRARDLVLDREVAVKILRETVDDSDRDRFVGEARMLARLSHVGLVTVLDAGTSGTQPFLVMDLVEGSTLAALLREGPLSVDDAAAIGAQMASAIAYAHAQGVVHRDVKPSNVLLGPGGDARLADFGIARLVGDTMRHTQTGSTIGTPAYLSPEQARGAPVGPPTDVYSLGLVLIEALTGERAFPGTPIESALARLHRPPEVPVDLPAEWRDLLTAMTASDPVDRPTAADVATRIEATRTPIATRVLPAATAMPAIQADDVATARIAATSRPTSGHRVRVLAVVGAIALIVVVFAVGGAVLRDGDGDPDDAPDPPVSSSAATAGGTEPADRGSATATEGEQTESTAPADPSQQGGDGKGKGKDKKDKDKGKGGKGKGGKGKGKN